GPDAGPPQLARGGMMTDFLLPDLGEGLTEATIVAWHVAVGDEVTRNQPLAEVETAKALIELPSPRAGRITALHAAEGETLDVGAPLVGFAAVDVPTTSTPAADGAASSTSAADGRAADGATSADAPAGAVLADTASADTAPAPAAATDSAATASDATE